MPYVNIKITREGGTTESQKAALINGVTDLLVAVLDKSPSTTMVVIDEVELPNWGIGGLQVEAYRRQASSPATGGEPRPIGERTGNTGLPSQAQVASQSHVFSSSTPLKGGPRCV